MMVVREVLEELSAQGRVIFYCSHVPEVLEKMCARVIILRKGRIVAQGAIADLRATMHRDSLEGIFAELAKDQNYDAVAHQMLQVMQG